MAARERVDPRGAEPDAALVRIAAAAYLPLHTVLDIQVRVREESQSLAPIPPKWTPGSKNAAFERADLEEAIDRVSASYAGGD
jgi:hypothetical protein